MYRHDQTIQPFSVPAASCSGSSGPKLHEKQRISRTVCSPSQRDRQPIHVLTHTHGQFRIIGVIIVYNYIRLLQRPLLFLTNSLYIASFLHFVFFKQDFPMKFSLWNRSLIDHILCMMNPLFPTFSLKPVYLSTLGEKIDNVSVYCSYFRND